MEADVFSRTGCEQLVAEAIEHSSQIDILVSNPAFSRRGAFLDYPPELFDNTINGTLTSGYHMSQLVARHMVEEKIAGKIVFISSVQAEMQMAHCFAYGAAKAGPESHGAVDCCRARAVSDQRQCHRTRLDRYAWRTRHV